MIRRRVPWLALWNNHGSTQHDPHHGSASIPHLHPPRAHPLPSTTLRRRMARSSTALLHWPGHPPTTTHWLHFQLDVLLFRGLSQFGERGGMVNPRQLPISLCLTASEPLRSMAMATAVGLRSNDTANAQTLLQDSTKRRALAAPPSDAQMIPRHWPLGPDRRKPCGPSCIAYTFGVCVRPQEMLCSSQTRSRKPTDGGGSRFPLSMRFPPPRTPNPVRSGALGDAEGSGHGRRHRGGMRTRLESRESGLAPGQRQEKSTGFGIPS